MDTQDFFSLILPQSGIKVLAEPRIAPDGGKLWRHFKFDTIEQAARSALLFDQRGINVYHACSTFVERREKGMRKHDNAGWQKSFWVDADVEAGNTKKYGDQREAIQGIAAVCKAIKLPAPLVVKSGAGLHVYWVLDAEVTTAQWKPVAELFKKALTHTGFKQDRTRTADQSSVLRPVGTHWRKQDVREVQMVRSMEPMSFDRFYDALKAYASAHDIETPESTTLAMQMFGMDVMSDLSTKGANDYPPSSALQIVNFCPTLKHIADTKGDVREPLWRAAIGVLKHTTEGENICHEWSMGHPDYNPDETQVKLDAWTTGPTTCATMRDTDDNLCDGCDRTCKSPIQLGYVEPTEPPEMEIAPSDAPVIPGINIPRDQIYKKAWPRGYTIAPDGVMQKLVRVEGVLTPVSFCDTPFHVIDRVCNETGTFELVIRMTEKNKRQRTFRIPAESVVSGELATKLGAYEVWVYGKGGKEMASQFTREYALNISTYLDLCETKKQFGWDNDKLEGFVIGSRMITKEKELEVIAGERIRTSGMDHDFGVAGTAEKWASCINTIYNRPGAEPYQFAFLVAAASPLIKLVGINGFHGIPIAFTGEGGRGKSTAALLAASMWGHRDKFKVAANEQGATMNALLGRVAIAQHLPMVMDEMTDQNKELVSGMAYCLSNGRDKDRLHPNGKFANGNLKWDCFTFITGNVDFMDMMYQLSKLKAEAVAVRVFEIKVPDDMNETVFAGVPVRDIVDGELQDNYGHAGRMLIRYYMEHVGSIRDAVYAMRKKFVPSTADQARERFYMDTVVFAMVAGAIMRKLGLINFDLAGIQRWAMKTIKELRNYRAERRTSDEDIVADFLTSLHDKTLVTNHILDMRVYGRTPEAVLNPPRKPPVARQALKDRRFIVASKAISDWCGEHDMQPVVLRNLLLKLGYVKSFTSPNSVGANGRFVIGAGTNVPTGQSRCYELDYDKVVGHVTEEVPVDNLLPFALAKSPELAAAQSHQKSPAPTTTA